MMDIVEIAGDVKNALAGQETKLKGLNMLAAIKRMEAALGLLYREYIEEANKEFAIKCQEAPSAKTYELAGGSVKRYTKAATYTYSVYINGLEKDMEKLKVTITKAKEDERSSGEAIKVEPIIDLSKDCTFAISIVAEKYPFVALKEVVTA